MAVAPTLSVSPPVFAIAMSASPVTPVAVVERSLPLALSPVVLTRAMLLTVGTAACVGVATTVTTTVAFTASGAVRRQVTMPAAFAQANDGPAADTNVSVAGSESTTRIVSVVAPEPMLRTVSV